MDNELLTQSYRALIYDEIEDYEQTIAGLSAQLQANPTNSHAFNNRAVAHWEIGRIAEALEDFRAAAAVDPTNAVPHVNRACSHFSGQASSRARCEVAICFNRFHRPA